VRSTVLKITLLVVFVAFLLYPIGYVFPSALVEREAPYRVLLMDAGPRPTDVLNVLGERTELGPIGAMKAAARPQAEVASGLGLDDAVALNQSIRQAGGTARLEGTLRPTLFYVGQVFASPFLWQCMAASLLVAAATTVLTTLVSLPLAVWVARFRFAGRGLLGALVLVPLILPPFVGAIGFRQIFSRFGTLNLMLMNAGLIDSPIDWLGASGLWGLVLLEVLHLYPIMYLNVSAALANVDPSLEDAARNLGGSEWTVFRRVTFPLVMPGYFAGASIVFVWAFTDLGTPIVIGYRRVVAYQIFERLSEAESNPLGYALVLVTLVFTSGLYWLARRFTTGRDQYAMVSKGGAGTSGRPAGGVRTAVILGYGGLITAVAVLPHLAVVLSSVAKRWSFTPFPSEYTGEYFALALTHKLAGLSIRNSIVFSSVSTLCDIVLGVSIAYFVARRPSWLSRALDTLAMLPLALPGLVLAFGYLTCYQQPAEWLAKQAKRLEAVGVAQSALPVTQSSDERHASPTGTVSSEPLGQFAPPRRAVWAAPIRGLGRMLSWLANNLQPQKSPFLLLVIAYAMRRLPYMSRAALAGFQQTSATFEEAAENLGATRWRVMRQITLPLIAANIVAGSILTFSFAVLEVSDSLMLAQRENYFPITKAIYVLLGRPDDGPYIASAMGVLGMLLLATALGTAAAVLGRRMGELFRA
jgi:iron(III) transport system permease protein